MNKRGQLVAMIAIAIAAVVFLVIVWPKLAVLLKGAGTQSTCNFNLLLSALVKAGSLGFAEIPPGCEAEYITIGKEEIDVRKNIANKRIKKYFEDTTGHYRDVLTSFPTDSGNMPTQAALDEWSLDYVMGKELADCANKVWHGKLDITARQWFSGQQLCIVCSVVTFGEDLPASIRKRDVVPSLYNWMNAEPYYSTTYYESAFEGLARPEFKDLGYTTKVPVAVVYTEQVESWFSKYAVPVGAWMVVGGYAVASVASGGVVAVAGGAFVAGAARAAVGGLTDNRDDTLKFLVLQPYELLGALPKDGGLGCTKVIA
jgi:hypothetical protein